MLPIDASLLCLLVVNRLSFTWPTVQLLSFGSAKTSIRTRRLLARQSSVSDAGEVAPCDFRGRPLASDLKHKLASAFCRGSYLDGPQPFRPKLDSEFHSLPDTERGKLNSLQASPVEVELLTVIASDVTPALLSMKLKN
jgi:hypothetical protein